MQPKDLKHPDGRPYGPEELARSLRVLDPALSEKESHIYAKMMIDSHHEREDGRRNSLIFIAIFISLIIIGNIFLAHHFNWI